MKLKMILLGKQKEQKVNVRVKKLVIAGWTGRDQTSMASHISELEALGIPRPAQTPTYYQCSTSLLTTNNSIEVVGNTSSGEVEFILISTGKRLLVGVGSDHTDREVEKIGVTISKQLCAKPIGRMVWRFDDVSDHWDQLILRSFSIIDGVRTLYQEGSVAGICHPADLLVGYNGTPELESGTVMFCGTFAVNGSIRPAESFEIELQDPVLGRKLRHIYCAKMLQIQG